MRRMIVAAVVSLLLLTAGVPALAATPEGTGEGFRLSVIAFVDRFFMNDTQAAEIIKKGLNDRFGAGNVAIFGDSGAKSPEYLEFIEKVQTDPANVKGISVVPSKYLAKYGQDIKASHVALVNLFAFNSEIEMWSSRRVARNKTSVTVYAADSGKVVVNRVFDTGEKELPFREAAQVSANQLKNDFTWQPNAGGEETRKAPEDRVAVLVFLPLRYMHTKPEIIAMAKKELGDKIRNGDVMIYGDFESKTPEYVEFIDKVMTDSATNKSFIVKKDHLTAFGKDAGYKTVMLIKMFCADGQMWDYRLKADVSVVAVEANKYVANQGFDSVEKMGRKEGVEFLLNKFKADFRMPALPAAEN